MEETSNDLMAEAPVDPMEAEIQRDKSRVQKTPQEFSLFHFADGDDKIRPFLKASKLSPDSFVEKRDAAPEYDKFAFRTDKSAWAHCQSDMTIPTLPGTNLIMVEAYISLCFRKAHFHCPAGTCHMDQARQRCIFRAAAQITPQLVWMGETAPNKKVFPEPLCCTCCTCCTCERDAVVCSRESYRWGNSSGINRRPVEGTSVPNG